MKHTLKKRLLIPLFLFITTLTAALAVGSSVFIKRMFQTQASHFQHSIVTASQQSIDLHLRSQAWLILEQRTAADALRVLAAQYGPDRLSRYVTVRSASDIDTFRYVAPTEHAHGLAQDDRGQWGILYRFSHNGTRKNHLFMPLAALGIFIDQPLSHLTLLIHHAPHHVIPLSTTPALTQHLRTFLLDTYRDYLHTKSATFPVHFSVSSLYPKLIFASTSTLSYTPLIIKIILGIFLVISATTAAIFLLYVLIIKKLTTSIDILRTVSKHVAQGNFSEKAYIQSNDEIGELATAFNQMVAQLASTTTEIVRQKEQSEAIISCIPDGIIVSDFNGHLLTANHQAETMFNFITTACKGQLITDCIEHSDFLDHLDHLKTDTNYKSEFTNKTDDPIQYYAIRSTVVTNKNGESLGVVYVIRDISYEKQTEELRDGFLRTVSHELRTPLTSVIGFIEWVIGSDKDPLSTEQMACLKTALKDARSLKTLINDLLELSHIQAKKLTVTPTTIAVFPFVDSIIESLQPLTKGKSLELQNHITDRTLQVTADQAKLRQILINLISNAIKFTDAGHIAIRCDATDETQVTWCVADTGIGLRKHDKDIVFEKFRQVDYSSTRQYEGSGLGLSIVRELVELHHGRVWVESTFGEGSSFYFTIAKNGV